jgi:adenylyltransferase/sulfurtransferase
MTGLEMEVWIIDLESRSVQSIPFSVRPASAHGFQEFKQVLDEGKVTVVDTRPEIEFGICSIPTSISTSATTPLNLVSTTNVPDIPLASILSDPESVLISGVGAEDVVFVCKKGNDSRLAARALRQRLVASAGDYTRRRVRDVRGGLVAWAKDVDPEFPLY